MPAGLERARGFLLAVIDCLSQDSARGGVLVSEARTVSCYSSAMHTASPTGALVARPASDGDLGDVLSMIDDFVKDHPARSHPRSREGLRGAFLGERAVAELVVAEWLGKGEIAFVGHGPYRRIGFFDRRTDGERRRNPAVEINPQSDRDCEQDKRADR